MNLHRRIGLLLLTLAVILASPGCKRKSSAVSSAARSPGSELSIAQIFENREADQFCNDLGFHLVMKAGDDGFKDLNASEQIAAAIWELEAEVNNGGFDQYFHNSAGDHWAETLKALETIGASKTAELLRRAIDVFPGKRPDANRTKRNKQMESLPSSSRDVWSDLDGKFYEYPEALHDLLMDYCVKHRDDFK